MQRDWMTCNLHLPIASEPAVRATARAVAQGDDDALAQLMLAAYKGTVDDGGETLDDACGEVRKLLTGEFGAFDATLSTVWIEDGAMAAATLLTRTRGAQAEPFVAFSMTLPAFQRRGLARAGLTRAMRQLREAGHARLHLVVTRANERAVALYRSCGLVVAAKPE